MLTSQSDDDGADEKDDPWKCAQRGDVEGMKRLLMRSDVKDWINKGDDSIYGLTPLINSSRNGHLEMVKLLLSSGGAANCSSNFGYTPLHEASANGHLEVVKILMSSGAVINCGSNLSYTPLHAASRNGHLEVVKLLLSSGADIDGTTNFRFTPLIEASGAGQLEVVKLLLTSGADINCSNHKGRTSLHHSCFYGFLGVVKYLLLSGANVNRLDNKGRSALDVAIYRRRISVVDTLLSAGACFSDKQSLSDIRMRSAAMADVIIGHLIWRRRKSFMMFLAFQKYLSKRGEDSGDVKEWLESRLISSPVHRVLMAEDLQRLLLSYL